MFFFKSSLYLIALKVNVYSNKNNIKNSVIFYLCFGYENKIGRYTLQNNSTKDLHLLNRVTEHCFAVTASLSLVVNGWRF